MQQGVLGNTHTHSTVFAEKPQEPWDFQIEIPLKLFFKSLKIILIINFFYLLNIHFFFPCKEEESTNTSEELCLSRQHSVLVAGETFVQLT